LHAPGHKADGHDDCATEQDSDSECGPKQFMQVVVIFTKRLQVRLPAERVSVQKYNDSDCCYTGTEESCYCYSHAFPAFSIGSLIVHTLSVTISAVSSLKSAAWALSAK
jgi:hypothetical protein